LHEALALGIGRQRVRGKELEGHETAQALLAALVGDTHATPANLLQEFVITESMPARCRSIVRGVQPGTVFPPETSATVAWTAERFCQVLNLIQVGKVGREVGRQIGVALQSYGSVWGAARFRGLRESRDGGIQALVALGCAG
jgi:hypothetical protein